MSTSTLQIQFLGLEEGSDPKNLPPGTLLRTDNCAMDKSRRLVKRAGTTGLVKTALTGSNVAAGKRLLTTGNDTAVTDGATAWTYAESLAKWNPIDRPPCWRATRRGLLDSTRSVDAIDSAIYGTMLVSVYQVSVTGGLYYQVDDLETGAPIVPATVIASTVCIYPRVLVSGTSVYFLLTGVGSSTISIFELPMGTLVLSSYTYLITSAKVGGAFDAVIGTPTGGVPTLYLAYEEISGTNRTTIASFTLSTLAHITSVAYLGTSGVSIGIAFGAASQRVLLVYALTAAAKMVTVDTALNPVTGPTSVLAAAAAYVFIDENDATNALVGWQFPRSSASEEFTTGLFSIAAAASVVASVRTTYGLYAPSKPWRTSGRWYCSAIAFPHALPLASDDKTPAASSVVVEIETANSLTGVQNCPHVHVATLENQTGWGVPLAGYLTKASVDDDGNVYVPAAYRNREPPHWYTTIPVGWNIYRLAANEADTHRPAVLGAGALCAGAAPYWFDGASTMPYGFAHPPCITTITDTGVGAMASGDYSYVATYAWRDANGILHRSTPSPPKTGTAGASRALTVRVHTASICGRQKTAASADAANPVFIELWRTTVGATGDHYRLSFEPLYQILVNDSRLAYVDLVDSKADANIGAGSNSTRLDAQARLYTDLGELANVPPPSLDTVTTHKGRLAGIGPDLRTVWFTKDSTQDPTQAPGFNEALTLAFAHDKTALASLDSVLVVFGMDQIDTVAGDGPDDAGSNNTWQIQACQTDVGCVNPRSPVVFPGGVIFESRVGLSLLDRGLNVSWIGEHVTETLDAYPNITSGVLVAEEQEVRWTCDDGETGIVLAFDYLNKHWFVRRYNDASDTATDDIRFVDAALIDGVYTLLTAGGQVYRETSAHFKDAGTSYVERDILLAPISATPGRSGWSNDNLGWRRVKDLSIMGTSVTEHDLEVSFAQDYATTFSQTKVFRAGTDVTSPADYLEKARVTVAVQKCQAVQIRIRDLTPTTTTGNSTGAGPIFESLMLRVGALDGPAQAAAGQRG